MSASDYAGNLLAVIHCDGGQYTLEHGWQKATDDAVLKWYTLMQDRDNWKRQAADAEDREKGVWRSFRLLRQAADAAKAETEAMREACAAAKLVSECGHSGNVVNTCSMCLRTLNLALAKLEDVRQGRLRS